MLDCSLLSALAARISAFSFSSASTVGTAAVGVLSTWTLPVSPTS